MDRVYKLRTKSTCPSGSDQNGNADVDLTTNRDWSIIKEGFPPGLTVDELKQYRRKRPQNINKPVDNLHLEEGSLKAIKTEYCRSFKPPSLESLATCRSQGRKRQDNLTLEQDETMDRHKAEYHEQFLNFPRERPRNRRPQSNLTTANDVPINFTTEKLEKFIAFPSTEKTKPLRRATALRPEGDVERESETQKEYHFHGNVERVRSMKRPSNLKIEGLFETLTSEQKEKYIAFLLERRETLKKRGTELKLEGDFDFETECNANFVNPGSQVKPPLRKRSTSLKLEGEAEFNPEYRKNFVEFPRSRPTAFRPNSALRSGGELSLVTEFRSQFIPHQAEHPLSAKLENNIHLEGKLNLVPEYRDQFIKHGKSKSEIIRRRDNLQLEGDRSYETENSKYVPSFVSEQTKNTKSSPEQTATTFPIMTEYHSSFLDFPRQRPQVRKPSANFKSDGPTDMTTESRSYGTVPRSSARRQKENLRPEGGIEREQEFTNKVEFPAQKEYSSFQVLDRSTPPIEQPSYRLEVHDRPVGFHRSPERIFPPKASEGKPFVSTAAREAAVEAAMKRRDQAPKPRKDLNGNGPSFTVLGSRPVSPKDYSGLMLTEPNQVTANFPLVV